MKRRIALMVLLGTLLLSLWPHPSAATFHLMKIHSLFPGTTSEPNAQYVMLQMWAANQNLVSGHFVRVYSAQGLVMATFTFTSNLANGANQATILIATTQAETLFGITADLHMTAVLPLAGGAVCFDAIPYDCVSWGNFSGTLPGPSSNPFNPGGGLVPGYALIRDISAGNPALLEDSDDTNDSAADFDCSETAQPKNNAGSTGSGGITNPTPCPPTLPAPPSSTPTSSPTQTPTPTSTQPMHDAVVLARKPVNINVAAGASTPIARKIRFPVRNADPAPGTAQTILLSLSNNCPSGVTIGNPDFDSKTNGEQDQIAIAAGKTKTAVAVVSVDHSVTTVNAKVPVRCSIFASASFPLVPGNSDPMPSNDVAIIELNIFDKLDTPVATTQETVMRSIPPLTIKIPKNQSSALKKTKPMLLNGDIIPTAANPGHSITLTADTSACPTLSFGAIDVDPLTLGAQPSVVVKGGATAKAIIDVGATNSVTTLNPKSPLRCSVVFTATGPSDPDAVSSNNDTLLTIDVLDKNDH